MLVCLFLLEENSPLPILARLQKTNKHVYLRMLTRLQESAQRRNPNTAWSLPCSVLCRGNGPALDVRKDLRFNNLLPNIFFIKMNHSPYLYNSTPYSFRLLEKLRLLSQDKELLPFMTSSATRQRHFNVFRKINSKNVSGNNSIAPRSASSYKVHTVR